MKKVLNGAKGFTMIELMVVLVIIGILATILVPQLLDNTVKAKFGEIPAVFGGYDHAQQVYYSEKTGIAATYADLSFTPPQKSAYFTYPDGAAGTLHAINTPKMGAIDAATKVASTKCALDGEEVVGKHKTAAGAKKYLPSFDGAGGIDP